MDKAQMDELLAPIGQLGAAMAGMEVSDAQAEEALREVLSGAPAEDAEAAAAAEARAARAAKSEARGKALEAHRHAQMAAALDARAAPTDGAGRRAVIKYYERCCYEYAAALEGDAIPAGEARDRAVASAAAASATGRPPPSRWRRAARRPLLRYMAHALDRARAIRAALPGATVADACDGAKRRHALLQMHLGGGVLSRAVASRKAALDCAAPWPRFVFMSDAADAFVVHLKTLERRGAAPPPAVLKATTDLMAELEALKAQLATAGTPPDAPPPPP